MGFLVVEIDLRLIVSISAGALFVSNGMEITSLISLLDSGVLVVKAGQGNVVLPSTIEIFDSTFNISSVNEVLGTPNVVINGANSTFSCIACDSLTMEKLNIQNFGRIVLDTAPNVDISSELNVDDNGGYSIL